jgi:choline dehydrogenase-like flavoprotein
MLINDMRATLQDPRVTLLTRNDVQGLRVDGGRVTGVTGRGPDGSDFEIRGDTVALGANAIYNPFLLLSSGIDDGPVGRGLQEQYSVRVTLLLDGLDDGDGSSQTTGVGYSEAHGDFRREVAGGFFETWNLTVYRPHPTRYRQRLDVMFLVDDLRDDRNFVAISDTDPTRPEVHFEGFSAYAQRGVDRILTRVPDIFAALPVEDVLVIEKPAADHKHIQGTTVMGHDPALSVVDGGLVHHRMRNLLVLGSGAFPTAGWANPTLTICATALRAADLYYGA